MEVFHYEFMQHAFLAGMLIAVLSGALGYFVVLRNLSFASHAMGHISFAGATGALLLGLSPMLGQSILTLASALLMGALGHRILKEDMTIGIVLAFALGLGSLFLALSTGYAGQASSILFGNLLGVSSSMLFAIAILTVISLGLLAFLSRPLFFASIEPELAEARGLPLKPLSIVFLCLMSIGVTLASQAVGVLLIFTLFIGPPAIALQWAKHFWGGLLGSILLALGVVCISLFLTYYSSWPLSFWVSLFILVLYVLSRGLRSAA